MLQDRLLKPCMSFKVTREIHRAGGESALFDRKILSPMRESPEITETLVLPLLVSLS